MIRRFAFAAALSLTAASATIAQEATAPAAQPEVTIDASANVAQPLSRDAEMLTGLYATLATVELCSVSLEPGIEAAIEADRRDLEAAVGLDAAGADTTFAAVRADVEKTSPDCAEGSPDRIGVDAVTAVYAARLAAAPQPAAAPAATTPAQ